MSPLTPIVAADLVASDFELPLEPGQKWAVSSTPAIPLRPEDLIASDVVFTNDLPRVEAEQARARPRVERRASQIPDADEEDTVEIPLEPLAAFEQMDSVLPRLGSAESAAKRRLLLVLAVVGILGLGYYLGSFATKLKLSGELDAPKIEMPPPVPDPPAPVFELAPAAPVGAQAAPELNAP